MPKSKKNRIARGLQPNSQHSPLVRQAILDARYGYRKEWLERNEASSTPSTTVADVAGRDGSAEQFGPPPGHPFRERGVEYVRPTPGQVGELFWQHSSRLSKSSRAPAGEGRDLVDGRRAILAIRIVARTGWAAEGSVVLVAGWAAGFESYPLEITEADRRELGWLDDFGLEWLEDTENWRAPYHGIRILIALPKSPIPSMVELRNVLAETGI